MNKRKTLMGALLLTACAAGGQPQEANPAPSPTPAPAKPMTATEYNHLLAHTVNFGNMLEAPNEGDWGLTVQPEFFDRVKEAGFTAIRLPVKWSGHAGQEAPYTIDLTFLARVDWAVAEATRRGLAIIVDFHHDDDLENGDVQAATPRFLGIWGQLAAHFAGASPLVSYELYNEPHGQMNDRPDLWHNLAAQAVAVIRQSDATRPVILGAVGWNGVDRLKDLTLPNDQNLIVTFHNYTPFAFTHQGAEWAGNLPTGVTWPQPGVRLGGLWQNWSWDSTVTGQDAGLSVQYQKGWAGLYGHSDVGASGVTTLRLKTDRAVKLRIRCMDKTTQTDGSVSGVAVETVAGALTELPLAACGSTGTVRDLFLQNDTPDPQSAYLLSTLELVGAGTTQSLFTSSRAELGDLLDRAAAWGQAQGRPVFLGEFGSYEKGDLASRVRWTTFVRSEAEQRGFSWGYWEFGAGFGGFGVYDPAAKSWRADSLRALLPDTEALER